MPTYPLRFFGPGLILDPHGQPIALRSRKQLALLAYLTTEHAITHSRDTLMALLWPQEGTASAQNNLRVTLARVRDLVNKIATSNPQPGDLLITDRHNVQLHPTWVGQADVNRFYTLVEKTRQHNHPSRGQCAHCQAFLHEAVQLYKGDFLTGFALDDCPAFEEWLFLQRERLRLLVIDAYHDLALFAEANGDLRAASDFVERQIELDPLREPAYRQQMRILARQGERSGALATFERCRTRLNDELGLDPELETLALHVQILTGEVAAPNPAPTSPAGAAPPRHNLPQQLTPFIGREAEMAQLAARLADPAYRLLSLVGPGGIGKSRLAQQVAAQQLDRFRDGVYFVALAQIQQPESIPAAIAETLGLTFSASQHNPSTQLVEMIRDKHLLLVLDNFEHLMEGVDLLVQLLQQAQELVLLVTSRERLNLQAEDLFELHGLATPTSSRETAASTYAAVRLFVDRAHRLDKHFKLTPEQLPSIVRICQLVEGLPLAIELAATWVQDWSCQEIVAELTAGLNRLETTLRDVDPQHRSLRAVFNSSWQLLSALERRTLALLAVFRGGFSVEAARSIANATPGLVGTLRNKSLLRSAGSRRYDMHALVQQFAAEALTADAEANALVRQRHSQYFLALLAEQAVPLDTRDARTAADKIQPDWENVATAWHDATAHEQLDGLQAALDGLVRFCDLRGLFQEAQTLLENSVARLETSIPVEQSQEQSQRQHLCCRLLTALAYFANRRGMDQTRKLAQKALALAEQIASTPEIISNYIILAAIYELTADYPRGIALAEQALHLAETHGLELHLGLCLDILGGIAYAASQYERANRMFLRVRAIHEKTGRIEQWGRAAIGRLGSIAIEQGRYEVALQYLQRYLESCEAIDDRRNLAYALHHWAYLWLRLGDFEKAIHFEEQSITRARILGDRETCTFALQVKAWAHRHAGQLPEARACAHEAVTLARSLDAQLALAYALGQLAETQLLVAQDDAGWAEAAALFQETATLLHAINKEVLAYEAEIGLAEVARQRGEIDTAWQLIQPILPHLPTVASEGWDEPLRAYVVCTQILRAVGDPAADTILRQGLALLDCLAQKISDPTLRQNFLLAFPAHRALRAMCDRMTG